MQQFSLFPKNNNQCEVDKTCAIYFDRKKRKNSTNHDKFFRFVLVINVVDICHYARQITKIEKSQTYTTEFIPFSFVPT